MHYFCHWWHISVRECTLFPCKTFTDTRHPAPCPEIQWVMTLKILFPATLIFVVSLTTKLWAILPLVPRRWRTGNRVSSWNCHSNVDLVGWQLLSVALYLQDFLHWWWHFLQSKIYICGCVCVWVHVYQSIQKKQKGVCLIYWAFRKNWLFSHFCLYQSPMLKVCILSEYTVEQNGDTSVIEIVISPIPYCTKRDTQTHIQVTASLQVTPQGWPPSTGPQAI